MTMVQWTVRAFGWIFVLIAALGFSASGMGGSADPAVAPRVLGLFPVNAAHNVLHLAFGLWAMFAYHWPRRAKRYATITGPIYLVLAGLGLLTPDLFGLAPIGGHDIWLHAAIGVVLTGVGFAAPDSPQPPAEP